MVKCAFSVSQKRGQSFFEIVLDFYRTTTGQREIFTVYVDDIELISVALT